MKTILEYLIGKNTKIGRCNNILQEYDIVHLVNDRWAVIHNNPDTMLYGYSLPVLVFDTGFEPLDIYDPATLEHSKIYGYSIKEIYIPDKEGLKCLQNTRQQNLTDRLLKYIANHSIQIK